MVAEDGCSEGLETEDRDARPTAFTSGSEKKARWTRDWVAARILGVTAREFLIVDPGVLPSTDLRGGHPMPVYPEPYKSLEEFEYLGELRLTRAMHAVQTRRGSDADYIVGDHYRARVLVRGDDDETYWHGICVPKGYKTDLVSVPRWGRVLVGRTGPYLEACIFHDWLYEAWVVLRRQPQWSMKEFADDVVKVAMEAAKVWMAVSSHQLGGPMGWRQGVPESASGSDRDSGDRRDHRVAGRGSRARPGGRVSERVRSMRLWSANIGLICFLLARQ